MSTRVSISREQSRSRWWRFHGFNPRHELIRPYRQRDRSVVLRDLAPALAASYPGGGQWLVSRLEAVRDGHAQCHLVRDKTGLCGITIETPKGWKQRKLSTIWVAPRARGLRLGGLLLDRCRTDWIEGGLESVWLTASRAVLPEINGLVRPRGFALDDVQADRYGTGRDEYVFVWSPQREPAQSRTDASGPDLCVAPRLPAAALAS